METILVLTDFSKRAENAAEYAMKFASKTGSNILLYNVIYEVLPVPEAIGPSLYYESVNTIEKYSKKQLENLEYRLSQKFRSPGAGQSTPKITSINDVGNLGSNVYNLLDKREISMVIMGSKGHDDMFNRFMFTSETNEVIEKSSSPVLMISEKCEYRDIKKIAFATDFEKSDSKAIQFIADVASIFNAEILLVHVVTHDIKMADKIKHIESFNKLKKKIKYNRITYEDIPGDDIASALVKFSAIENIDILSIAPKKRSFIERLFHHSTTEDMMRYQNIPLMVFPSHFH